MKPTFFATPDEFRRWLERQRLQTLIEDSAAGRRIGLLRRTEDGKTDAS